MVHRLPALGIKYECSSNKADSSHLLVLGFPSRLLPSSPPMFVCFLTSGDNIYFSFKLPGSTFDLIMEYGLILDDY